MINAHRWAARVPWGIVALARAPAAPIAGPAYEEWPRVPTSAALLALLAVIAFEGLRQPRATVRCPRLPRRGSAIRPAPSTRAPSARLRTEEAPRRPDLPRTADSR